MLLAFFGLWQSALVAGGVAVAVPVIIHLLNRRRFKIVTWAAMRFLLAAQRQNTRRMRVEQLLLLLVRCLLVALIVFAMGAVAPWAEDVWAQVWPDGLGKFNKRSQRVHHLFVIDGSLSMNVAGEGRNCFEAARQLALQKLADCASGDGYSVLLLKDSPTWLVGEVSQDSRKVARELETMRPSHGNASVTAALNLISGKLTEASGRFPSQAVYFFTDLQASTWNSAAAVDKSDKAENPEAKEKNPYTEIQQKASIVFVDVGRDEQPNLAVTRLEFLSPFVTSNSPLDFLAGVQNFSRKPKADVRVELLIGKAKENAGDAAFSMRAVESKQIDVIEAGATAAVRFSDFKFPGPGTYAVQVKLEADALEQDDTRTVVVTVRDTIPVLLVNGKAAADRYERATEYLRLALNPFVAGAEPKFAPLRPRVISPTQFVDLPEAELANYDCVVWCDVGQFGQGELRRLETHLRRGGGFIVSMGDQAVENLDTYNRLLYKDEQGILPVRLLKKVQASPDHYFQFHVPGGEYKDPPLDAFSQEADQVSLRSARFRQFVQAQSIGEGKARTVMTFMPARDIGDKGKFDDTLPKDQPAFIEWNPPVSKNMQLALPRTKDGQRVLQSAARYRGKVIVFTSSLNMDWTSWPGSPSYGAMMQETTRLAVSGRLKEQSAVVGSLIEEYLPGGGAEIDATIYYPASVAGMKPGKARTQLIDEVNVLRWTDTDYSGIYRVALSTGQELPFAVNVPISNADQKGSESDLSRIDAAKLKDLFPNWDIQVVQDARTARMRVAGEDNLQQLERVPVGPTIANVALLLALFLLFAEVILAWQFGHYTTSDGTTTPMAEGWLVPLLVAGFFAAVFTLGAAILLHASQTGDFLGFFPDFVRSWAEGLFGVPPPPPGEGTHWQLENHSYLFGLGNEGWWAGFLSLVSVVLVVFIYRAEAPMVSKLYKLVLAGLRIFLVLLMLHVLLPRIDLSFDRQGWPDLVLLIDNTRSMGEPDTYQDDKTRNRVKLLSDNIRKELEEKLPDRIQKLQAELASKQALGEKNPDAKLEAELVGQRLAYWQKQQETLANGKWRPSRLQLVQAMLAQPEPDWLKTMLNQRQTKIHVFQLDSQGRAAKLTDEKGLAAGEILDPADPTQLERARVAIANIEPEGRDSRLGTALRQVIDNYRGASLSAVLMFTDGVTTRDETIAQAAEYAGQKGVPLFFVGLGDEHEIRDMKLHDLQVEDQVYVGDRVVFEARITGQGYKDTIVPIVLKLKDKNGKEKEVDRELVKVDPAGKPVKFRLRHQPAEVGKKQYIIEVEPPKGDGAEKPISPANLRLERTIEVVDTKQIKVLYVEGQPRYEFRYIKFLMEREAPEDLKKGKKKSIDLKVVMLDADDNFAEQDRTALSDFPATLDELNQYDVVILGDCDPKHRKLGEQRLRNLANFVKGEDNKGNKAAKSGGGLLMIAGTGYAPHAYKDTPLADVLPIEPLTNVPPKEPERRTERYRPELTPVGRFHPIFRFNPDEGENLNIWNRLTPMYWWSTGYRMKPLAEVLAVHPSDKAVGKQGANQDGRQPLVVQQFVGTGRSMFFGFDETWRWRLREDEAKYNNFWIQTMRYLSRGRSNRTDLRLDRQTPYRLGEPIKVTVRFPDSGPADVVKPGSKAEVKLTVEYRAGDAKDQAPEVQTMQLAKVEGSWGTFEGSLNRTREGRYRFRLVTPDVRKTQPDGEQPSTEATVELPPGELDKLRMNYQDMQQAADATQGRFYNLSNAEQVLEDLPPGVRVSLSSQMPPVLVWNTWYIFLLVMSLLTAEWLLRKRKHLL
jgi:hypothetical protein